MELIIVRHADAHAIGEHNISSDRERDLTSDGRRVSERLAESLKALGHVPDRIGSSPFKRALQTAQILAATLRPGDPPETCQFLAPGAQAKHLIKWLHTIAAERVMVVGHAPDVENIASEIISRKEGLDIHFGKGAACCLTFESTLSLGAGRLEWLIQGKQLLEAK